MRADPSTHCAFLVPDGMAAGSTAWIGDCAHGHAEGPGVLRVTVPGQDAQLFAGLMHDGRPVRGIVDKGRAGNSDYGPAYGFDGAHAVYAKSRAELIEGFRAASGGASAAGAAFARQGNTGSANFYAGWSRALAAAPDKPE